MKISDTIPGQIVKLSTHCKSGEVLRRIHDTRTGKARFVMLDPYRGYATVKISRHVNCNVITEKEAWLSSSAKRRALDEADAARLSK